MSFDRPILGQTRPHRHGACRGSWVTGDRKFCNHSSHRCHCPSSPSRYPCATPRLWPSISMPSTIPFGKYRGNVARIQSGALPILAPLDRWYTCVTRQMPACLRIGGALTNTDEGPARGNNMSVRKLTDAQARAAHRQVKKGLGPPELAEKYGVSRSSIYDLCKGKTYRHLGLVPLLDLRARANKRQEALTDKQARAAFRYVVMGETDGRVAKRFSCTTGVIWKLRTGKTHRHLNLPIVQRPDGNGQTRRTPASRRCIDCGKLLIKRRESLKRFTARKRCQVCSHREQVGEKSSAARLKESQVRQIHALGQAGDAHREIAHQFGVTKVTVSNICRAKTWRHLGLPPISKRRGK